jgi:hypothetical protein
LKVELEGTRHKAQEDKVQGVNDEKTFGFRKNNIEMLHLNEKLICRK